MNFNKTHILLSVVLCFISLALLPARGTGAEADSLFTQGKVLYEMGEYEQAKERFVQCLTKNPEDPVALYYAGKTELDGAKSQEYFRALLTKFPGHELADDALFQIAQYWYAKGYYITAQQQFLRLLEQYPQSPFAVECQYYIGRIMLALDNPKSAQEHFQKLVQLYPNSEVAVYAACGLVDSYQLQGKYNEAISLADSLLNKSSSLKSHLLYVLADCYRKTGEGQKSKEMLDRITQEFPQSYEATVISSPSVFTPKSTLVDSAATEVVPSVKDSDNASGQYYIQAGAFGDIANATALQGRLATQGLSVTLATMLSEQKLLYVVRVGPYKDRKSADKAAERIRKKEAIPCWVRQITSETE